MILVWEAFKIWLEGFEWQSKKELLKQVPHKMQKHLGMGCKRFIARPIQYRLQTKPQKTSHVLIFWSQTSIARNWLNFFCLLQGNGFLLTQTVHIEESAPQNIWLRQLWEFSLPISTCTEMQRKAWKSYNDLREITYCAF